MAESPRHRHLRWSPQRTLRAVPRHLNAEAALDAICSLKRAWPLRIFQLCSKDPACQIAPDEDRFCRPDHDFLWQSRPFPEAMGLKLTSEAMGFYNRSRSVPGGAPVVVTVDLRIIMA